MRARKSAPTNKIRALFTVGVSGYTRIVLIPFLSGAQSLSVPTLLMFSLGFGVTVVKQRVVIVQIKVMRLQPYPGSVDCIAMRRETAVTLVDVSANVLGAGNHFVLVMRDFFEIFVTAIASEYAAKIRFVPVSPSCSVFRIHNWLDGICHGLIEGRAHAFEIGWQSDRIGSHLGVKCSPAEEIEPAITWRDISETERRQQLGRCNGGVDPATKPHRLQH